MWLISNRCMGCKEKSEEGQNRIRASGEEGRHNVLVQATIGPYHPSNDTNPLPFRK
jgi:hypothetical protein